MGYALITGASGGIGRELAALFAADGHDLVITARSQERLDMIKTKLEQRFGVHVVTFAIDLSEANAPKKLHDFTTSQGIAVDHLVNNAGFADWTDFLDADWNRQNEMMQLNMHALAELTYRYGRDMRAMKRFVKCFFELLTQIIVKVRKCKVQRVCVLHFQLAGSGCCFFLRKLYH